MFYVEFKSIRNVIMLYFGTIILLVLFSFTVMFDISSLWSVPQSAPGLVLAERIQLLNILLPITQSI